MNEGMDMSGRGEAVVPTRRSLLTRLRSWDDQEGWRQFFETYWRLIYGVARKAGLGDAEAQDVVQETVISVAKRMRQFRYDPARGSFKSWLRLITRRRIADFLREQYRRADQAPGGGASDQRRAGWLDQVSDSGVGGLTAVWDAEWEAHVLATAARRVRRRVDARQYQMFDCYVLKGWAPAEVARTLGVSVGQVYLAKHRVGPLLREEIERVEGGLV
jgi:RNA polymerase sigma factor (sigma-70 family)